MNWWRQRVLGTNDIHSCMAHAGGIAYKIFRHRRVKNGRWKWSAKLHTAFTSTHLATTDSRQECEEICEQHAAMFLLNRITSGG